MVYPQKVLLIHSYVEVIHKKPLIFGGKSKNGPNARPFFDVLNLAKIPYVPNLLQSGNEADKFI
jgi:hypothetical protein